MFGLSIKQDQKDKLISSLMEENERLKVQNNALIRENQNLKKMSDEYKELIGISNSLKEKYEKGLVKLDKITAEYEKQLNEVVKQAKRENNKYKE